MMTHRRWVPGRGLRALTALGVLAVAAVWWPAPRLDAQAAPTAVEISGTGASEVVPLMTLLSAPFDGSPRPVGLSYIARGDRDGRGVLARGEADFAISGRPFTSQDEEALASRDVGVIEAPFSLSSIAFLMSAPDRGQGDPFNPTPIQTIFAPDPEEPSIVEPAPEPFRLSAPMLANTFLFGSGPWNSDELNQINQIPPPKRLASYSSPASRVARSDPGALNYYLEGYLRQADPVAWEKAAAGERIPVDTHSESWPFVTQTPTRNGDSTVGSVIESWVEPVQGGRAAGGAVGPVSTATANVAMGNQLLRRILNQKLTGTPDESRRLAVTPLYLVAIPNGAGEYLQPTPETLTRAAEAGGGKPLYGLTEDVPGAYPLTFVESIYVPDRGLSVDTTNALSTLMRVQATGGQDLATRSGEGRLPAAMTLTTMLKADEVVKGNCKGADRKIVTITGGGELWPPSVAAPTSALLCQSVNGPSPQGPSSSSAASPAGGGASSTGDSGSGSGALSSGPLGSSGVGSYGSASDSAPAGSDSVAEATAAAAAAASEESALATPVSSNAELPLPSPSTGRYVLDRLVTLLLGGAAFLLLRGLLRGRLAA